ncbi:hypothetical protein [Patulibacter sp. SYSU D01012]|uniref:hypothetical protein n=1 Tax=Patulibacter sp. SYSU D01012 TaxID=2817381 RepID=UPI001B30AD24|nr:hypothetical protein [Patulibacter sp. SYSU D01012]
MRARPALLPLAAAVVVAGCGGGDATTAAAPAARAATTARAAAPAPRRPRATPAAPSAPPRSWDATCPTPTPSALGCRAVRGRVLAIESHDPDGDGDLHVVAYGGGVTAPGITIFDVRASLRPRRDPRPGQIVTGAGPVFPGSHRQRQIQVDVFRVWRPRR